MLSIQTWAEVVVVLGGWAESIARLGKLGGGCGPEEAWAASLARKHSYLCLQGSGISWASGSILC